MKNKKGNAAVVAIIIVIVAITASVITWMVATKTQLSAQQPVATKSTTPAPSAQTSPQPVVTQPKQEGIIYKNDEYNFQMTLPQSWTKYKVEKQSLSNEESLSGKTGEIILAFNYPFDNPIPRVEGDKSMDTLDKDWLWMVRVIPVANWKADLCGNKPLCVQGKVLAKNSLYVFEDIGQMNVGAGELCNEQPQKLTMFCKALNDFDESKINFQLTK